MTAIHFRVRVTGGASTAGMHWGAEADLRSLHIAGNRFVSAYTLSLTVAAISEKVFQPDTVLTHCSSSSSSSGGGSSSSSSCNRLIVLRDPSLREHGRRQLLRSFFSL